MKTELRRFLMAMGYFTRIPVPAWVGWEASELNRAARYFPWIGWLVGIASALVMGFALLFLPQAIAVLLGMLASLLLTGAFHEDGLADSADGFGGGWQTGDVLRIMKDSRIGTYGAASLLIALLFKFMSLYALCDQGGGYAMLALWLMHPLSRLAALLVMFALPYVRDDESARAKPVAEGLGRRELWVGLLGGVSPLVLCAGLGFLPYPRVVFLGLSACLVARCCIAYFRRRIGGYTGDCLGATQQIAELVGYLVLCAHSR